MALVAEAQGTVGPLGRSFGRLHDSPYNSALRYLDTINRFI